MVKFGFWHPPIWKWGLVVLLTACSAFLLFWKPAFHPPKVELLPLTYARPTWDGSYPYLVISPIDNGLRNVKFKSEIRWIRPTVYHESPINQFQVDLHWGMFVLRQTDFFISDTMPLTLTRTYRPWDPQNRAFGVGTNHPYDICPTMTRFPYTYADLNLEDGRQIHFRRISKGTGFADAVFRHDETASEFSVRRSRGMEMAGRWTFVTDVGSFFPTRTTQRLLHKGLRTRCKLSAIVAFS